MEKPIPEILEDLQKKYGFNDKCKKEILELTKSCYIEGSNNADKAVKQCYNLIPKI